MSILEKKLDYWPGGWSVNCFYFHLQADLPTLFRASISPRNRTLNWSGLIYFVNIDQIPACLTVKMRSNPHLLPVGDRPIQAYFNVETLASLIFEPFVPARFGVTGRKTIIIRVDPRITALYPPTLALTARSRGPFLPGSSCRLVASFACVVVANYRLHVLQGLA